MKARLFLLTATIFAAQLSTAQLLYTEDFESYNTGPFSTDLTGTTPAQGGWHTIIYGFGTGIPTVDDFQIVSDNSQGNVLQVLDGRSFSNGGSWYVTRTDLNTYWQQRTTGNDVLKLAFDMHTGFGGGNITSSLQIQIFNNKELLTNFQYRHDENRGHVIAPNRGMMGGGALGTLQVDLPDDSWVTIELYIDYNNDRIYLSVPSLNYTVAADTKFPLFLSGGGDDDDNPVKLEITASYGGGSTIPMSHRIDNINMSAQGSAPLVSINEFVSSKFNLYPNPATNIVTISNNEHIGINLLMVYDVTGKQISTYSYKDEHEVQVNVDGLNSGIYFLHIVTDEGTGIKKLVKK